MVISSSLLALRFFFQRSFYLREAVITLLFRKGNDSTCLLDDHSDSDPEIVVVDTISKIGRWRHYAIAFVVIASATLIAFCTDDVLILTSITGSYPGVGVQYIIPSIIAIYGRRYELQLLHFYLHFIPLLDHLWTTNV